MSKKEYEEYGSSKINFLSIILLYLTTLRFWLWSSQLLTTSVTRKIPQTYLIGTYMIEFRK